MSDGDGGWREAALRDVVMAVCAVSSGRRICLPGTEDLRAAYSLWDRDCEIRALVRAGQLVSAVAARHGLSPRHVRRISKMMDTN